MNRDSYAPSSFAPPLLALLSCILLILCAVRLSDLHRTQLEAIQTQAAHTRAQMLAQTLANRFEYAVSQGIPLKKLAGVTEMLEQWRQASHDIGYIAVFDQQQIRWQVGTPMDEGVPTASVNILTSRESAHLTVQIKPTLQGLGTQELGLYVMPVLLLVGYLSYWGACVAWRRGSELRDNAIHRSASQILKGHFSPLRHLPNQALHDMRFAQLSQHLQRVIEALQRLQRLVGLLRQTEPSHTRRAQLDAILQEHTHHWHYRADTPRLHVTALPSEVFWLMLLISVASIAAWWPHDTLNTQALPTLLQGWMIYCVGFGAGYALWHWLHAPIVPMLASGSVAMFALAWWPSDAFVSLAIQASGSGTLVGAACSACGTLLQRVQSHPQFEILGKTDTSAAIRAWWIGALWIAPLLCALSIYALPDFVSRLGLCIPSIAALFWILHCNVPYSPWRLPLSRNSEISSALGFGKLSTLSASLMVASLLASPYFQQYTCAVAIGLITAQALNHRWQPALSPRWCAFIGLTGSLLLLAAAYTGTGNPTLVCSYLGLATWAFAWSQYLVVASNARAPFFLALGAIAAGALHSAGLPVDFSLWISTLPSLIGMAAAIGTTPQGSSCAK